LRSQADEFCPDRKRTNSALSRQWKDAGDFGEIHLHLAGQKARDDLGGALVWYVLHVDAGFLLQQFAGDMGEVSESDGAIVQRARMGFGVGDERRQGLGGTCRIHNHNFMALDEPCDRR